MAGNIKTEMVFVKEECGGVDVKKELVEEEDPLCTANDNLRELAESVKLEIVKEELCEDSERIKQELIEGFSSISASLESAKYTCNICEYTGPDMGSVKYHKKVKHGKYSCKVCQFVTDSIKLRNQHIQAVHGYICNLCEYTATTAGNLRGRKNKARMNQISLR